MAELEHELRQLASEIEWPPTPPMELQLPVRRGWPARGVWVAVAALVLALGVALGVPAARSAILRVLHLGGVTVEQVAVLPSAQERPLSAGLGRPVDAATAQAALGGPVQLPAHRGTPVFHLRDGVVSVLLAAPQPVLLSEITGQGYLMKKIVGSSTNVAPVSVDGTQGFWISGAPHVLLLPQAVPRVAGNVLIWQRGTITYRLEGRGLNEQAALRLATQIQGT
jgi:hypothetical protein